MTYGHPYAYKTRILRLLLLLLEAPYHYTRKELAARMEVSPDAIKHDLQSIRDAGLVVLYDKQYRYALAEDRSSRKLKELLILSEEERMLLLDTLEKVAPDGLAARRLRHKLEALFTVGQLGKLILRRPYLSKVETLQRAIERRRCVLLERYRSLSSNRTRDRKVEAFHFDAGEDVVQAFDPERGEVRVFRISRCERIRLTDEPWQHENRHLILATDPFRVADPKQLPVHLTLTTGGYNLMVEQFPLTRAWLQPAAEPEQYDLQCQVNHRFLGLTNFILGNHAHVLAIHDPPELIEHLRQEVARMHFLEKN